MYKNKELVNLPNTTKRLGDPYKVGQDNSTQRTMEESVNYTVKATLNTNMDRQIGETVNLLRTDYAGQSKFARNANGLFVATWYGFSDIYDNDFSIDPTWSGTSADTYDSVRQQLDITYSSSAFTTLYTTPTGGDIFTDDIDFKLTYLLKLPAVQSYDALPGIGVLKSTDVTEGTNHVGVSLFGVLSSRDYWTLIPRSNGANDNTMVLLRLYPDTVYTVHMYYLAEDKRVEVRVFGPDGYVGRMATDANWSDGMSSNAMGFWSYSSSPATNDFTFSVLGARAEVGDQIVSYSFDNANTWQKINTSPIETTGGRPEDAAVAVDDDNKVHLVWTELAGTPSNNINVFYKNFTFEESIEQDLIPTGWSTLVQLDDTTDTVDSSNPNITVISGEHHVCWTQAATSGADTIYYDGGALSRTDVTTTSGHNRPSIAAGADGSIIIATGGPDGADGHWEFHSFYKGPGDSAFTDTEIFRDSVTGRDFGYPSIASNAQGKVVIAYRTLVGAIDRIRYVISSDNGENFGSELDATPNSLDSLVKQDPSIAIDSKGSMVLAYEALDNDSFIRLYKTHKLYNEDDWVAPYALDQAELQKYDNLVLNGGFNDWTAGVPDNWTEIGSPGTTELTSSPVEGTAYLGLSNSDENSNYIEQDVDLSGFNVGDIFILKSIIRPLTGAGNVQFGFPNVSGTYSFHRAEAPGGASSWQYTYSIMEKSEEGAQNAEIKIFNDSTSDGVDYDGISIEPLLISGTASYPISGAPGGVVIHSGGLIWPWHNPNVIVDPDFMYGHSHVMYGRDTLLPYEVRVNSSTTVSGINIGDDMLSLRISRDQEFGKGTFGAGDFSIVLDNKDAKYNIERPDSAFHGRLRSGSELNFEIGIREYSGSGDVTDPSNWHEELFPMMIGVASKFRIDSNRETITISGRDRADKLMAYRNYTSPLFQSRRSIELIRELANEDYNNDGRGDYDHNRPTINLDVDARQQPLAAFNESLVSGAGTNRGDAGSNLLTQTVLQTADANSVRSYASNTASFIGAWVDRSTSENFLWSLTVEPLTGSTGTVYLDKWSGWENSASTLVHEQGWDIGAQWPDLDWLGAVDASVSGYDPVRDVVWLMINWRTSSSDWHMDIRTLDFKSQTISSALHTFASAQSSSFTNGCGCLVVDYENDQLYTTDLRDRNTSGGGTDWPHHSLFNIGGTPASPTLTNVYDNDFQDDADGTNTTGLPYSIFPTCGVKFGDYYYLKIGYQRNVGSASNPSSFGAMARTNIATYDFDLYAPNINFNTALCWVVPDSSNYVNTAATGEDFFDNAATQRRAIRSIDYDEDFVYIFCNDDADMAWDGSSGTIPNASFQIRRLASRTYNLKHDNIISTEHTKANGYLEDDTDFAWNATESIRLQNDDITIESNTGSYNSTTGIWNLSGTADQTSGFSDAPIEDYEINLESGEVLMGVLADKSNHFFADYDFASSVPFAWFEETSIWDAIQEVASAGDFVCYVNETGTLEFKDRFTYYYPIISDYEDNLQSDGTWANGQEYAITDLTTGAAITNIIPGLETIISAHPDPVTGVYRTYKRRSFVTGGTTQITTEGDYDINYDTGEIGWFDTSDIPSGERVRIYFYNNDHLFNYSYDSNIYTLNYRWGVDDIANRVTVKGERYFPSESPISVREVYVVNPGDGVVNTKFASIKQIQPDASSNSLDQYQYDQFANVWRNQSGSPAIDFEFRNKLIGDTAKAREAGNAIRMRIIPCVAPGDWASEATSATEIPANEVVGQGYKINWDFVGDTGVVPAPNGNNSRLDVTGVEIDADGLRITVDHKDRDDKQYFLQLELEGYTLTRVFKFTALHENFDSIKQYYTRSFELENRFISDIEHAKERARFISHLRSTEKPRVELEVVGSPFLELGDVISIKDANTGLAGHGDYFTITGLEDRITRDDYTTKLTVEQIADKKYEYIPPAAAAFGAALYQTEDNQSGDVLLYFNHHELSQTTSSNINHLPDQDLAPAAFYDEANFDDSANSVEWNFATSDANWDAVNKGLNITGIAPSSGRSVWRMRYDNGVSDPLHDQLYPGTGRTMIVHVGWLNAEPNSGGVFFSGPNAVHADGLTFGISNDSSGNYLYVTVDTNGNVYDARDDSTSYHLDSGDFAFIVRMDDDGTGNTGFIEVFYNGEKKTTVKTGGNFIETAFSAPSSDPRLQIGKRIQTPAARNMTGLLKYLVIYNIDTDNLPSDYETSIILNNYTFLNNSGYLT